jgi:hypothetical protein
MEDIYNYIAIELMSPENAMGQYNRIADEILTLDVLTVVVKKENVNGGVELQFQSLDYGATWNYMGEVK